MGRIQRCCFAAVGRKFTQPELNWSDHDCRNVQLPVNPEILWDLLLQLDLYKSMGPDGIHPRILKELAEVITKTLSMIFEWSCESREVSADWKLANVVLIFKKGKKEDRKNCRPVSLTLKLWRRLFWGMLKNI
ncbi:RNA-directed DNA polymerase from mobile element jockey [Pitangus sulphuratus]|nr:RNA-directed DNA polymerase from mobile element jockey [Pitangus sulphuratus]